MVSDRDRLAAVLKAHRFGSGVYGQATCLCGWSAPLIRPLDARPDHDEHLTDCLLMMLAAPAPAGPLEISNEQGRHWALANVKRATAKILSPLPCGHARNGEALQYQTCVGCAWELGRREGHVDAGAVYTMDEAMQILHAYLLESDSAAAPNGSAKEAP